MHVGVRKIFLLDRFPDDGQFINFYFLEAVADQVFNYLQKESVTSFDGNLWHCVLHVSFKSTDSPSDRKYESLDMSTNQLYVILDVPCDRDAHGAAGPPLISTL